MTDSCATERTGNCGYNVSWLRSPVTGRALRQDDDVSMVADGERWPVIDGIPFLRTGREALIRDVLAALDAGDRESATVTLLGDRDDWATSPGPDPGALRELVRERETLSFRAAMAYLALGSVATYFAHRWSDPTYLSGLAFAEAFWLDRPRVVEIACGAGHFLPVFGRSSAQVIGADVVFAKLWLARHWVAPDAALVCFDASRHWPLNDASGDFVFCHDAFYFLPNKPEVAREMERVAAPGGTILCGHAHNALAENHSRGCPLSPSQYRDLFETAILFDDAELTAALVERRAPVPQSAEALGSAQAISIAARRAASMQPRPVLDLFGSPPQATALRRNPLYVEEAGEVCVVQFPSQRYAAEYGELATYPRQVTAAPTLVAGIDPANEALIRRRVWLELPSRW